MQPLEWKATSPKHADYAPGMRILVRGQEWLVRRVDSNTLGNAALHCVGISPLVHEREAIFLEDLDDIEIVDPAKTRLVIDRSPRYRDTRLYLESALRRTAPTDASLHIGQKAAMDQMSFQYLPAYQALRRPRQRILIADTVGLGKTLEAGILMSELIARGKGKRILVVTTKSMLTQFQMEMWNRFTIPLVRLDSARIQRIRRELASNANPFYYYDKTIVSIDTIKRGIEYGVHLENAYWDIIVIDEAQNVAQRGGTKLTEARTSRSQRSTLAEKLSSRSDTLIMLSATPHDGRPQSFASLMNMLDPTAIADPQSYTPDDIKGLCVRRFKKDVRAQIADVFQERNVEMVPCTASLEEELAFDIFSDMRLTMDEQHKGSTSGLFKISLEKALFSSPMACIATIDERLKKLAKMDPEDKAGDASKLRELRDSLALVLDKSFSRYQGLLSLLRGDEFKWDPGDTSDRLVIFTERIATMKWVAEHLRRDLGLPDNAVITMDGSLSDMEQQDIVKEFGRESSPVRVLVASDVASEGINLHYLSHRLVHFDTPWSLMVFQQRNGRIDRYGQKKRPEIRFLTTSAKNKQIRGDARILQILIEKERQAAENIGDPAMLLGKFSVDEETRVVEDAIASGANEEEFEKQFTDDEPGDDCSLLDLLAQDAQDDVGSEGVPLADDRTLLSDFEYLDEGIQKFGKDAGVTREESVSEAGGVRLWLDKSGELYRHLRKVLPDSQATADSIILSPDKAYCMEEKSRSRNVDFELGDFPQAQYLWKLHPVLEWIGDKAAMTLFGRDEAPVVGTPSLASDEAIFLVQGTIPNRKAAPVVDEWFGLDFKAGKLAGEVSLHELVRRTSIDDQGIPNWADITDGEAELIQTLCPNVVQAATDHMASSKAAYSKRISPQIDEELDHINALAEKHEEYQMTLPGMERERESTKMERLLTDYSEWVKDTLEVQETPPNIRIQAVFMGVQQ